MIDLHNHLLPAIDDGAADLEASVELARMALADGITHLVCTPHIHPGRYDNDCNSIRQAHQGFAERLASEGIPLKTAWAAEVRFGAEIMQSASNGTLPLLGSWQGMQVLLLEFPHGGIPFGAERLTDWLIQRNILPMIAHPERNKQVMRTPGSLKPFIQQGCLLQVTAGAVAGRFGPAARDLAGQLLEQKLVTILATDAHNVEHRPPLLQEGLQAAAQFIGEQQARRLVFDNPMTIASPHFS